MNTVDFQVQVRALARELGQAGSRDALAMMLATVALRPCLLKGDSVETMQRRGGGLVVQVQGLEPHFTERRQRRQKARKFQRAENKLRSGPVA